MVPFLLVIQMGKEIEAQEKCACGWVCWGGNLQMDACAIYQSVCKCTSLRTILLNCRNLWPIQFASYIYTPNCYNCGWHFTVLSLYSVMLKGIWFLFLVALLHHKTAWLPHMYLWQMMPRSYLTMFPTPHLKKTVPKLSNLTYSHLHEFCSYASSSSVRWQQ